MYFSDNFLRRALGGVKTCEKREKHKNTKVKAQSPVQSPAQPKIQPSAKSSPVFTIYHAFTLNYHTALAAIPRAVEWGGGGEANQIFFIKIGKFGLQGLPEARSKAVLMTLN